MVNMNEFAIAVCKREGGKVNLSIAQIKEVIKCTFQLIAEDIANEEGTTAGDWLKKIESYY